MYFRDAIQEDLNQLVNFYSNSYDVSRFQAICSDANLLVGLISYDIIPYEIPMLGLSSSVIIEINILETFERGYVKEILSALFQEYNADFLIGYSTVDAYGFWRHLGAIQQTGEPIPDPDDLSLDVWEGNFVLTREEFYNYYNS